MVNWLSYNTGTKIYYFINSNNIQVYPSAYRNPNLDFSARLNLEENFVTLSKQINKNYILSWEETNTPLLTCFIGGYLFKIKINRSDIFGDNETDNSKRWLNIKILSQSLAENEQTKVLANWNHTAIHQTINDETTAPNDYVLDCTQSSSGISYFIGACFTDADLSSQNVDADTGVVTIITAIDLKSQATNFAIDSKDVLSALQKDTDARSIATNLVNGIATSNSSDKNYFNDTSITNIYYNNSDNKNVATANTLNKTRYSFLFGKTVSIEGTNSSTADYDFVLGRENHITSAGKYDTLFGQYLNSQYNNQLIIGKYNNNTSGNVFEIGWGSGTSGAADERKNIFEVNTGGNVSAKGTLTIGQDLQGTDTALTVYAGQAYFANNVEINSGGLTISNNGGAEINGHTIITGYTELDGMTSIYVNGESEFLDIHGNTNITGGLSIEGDDGTLFVEKTTTLKGTTSVQNTTLRLYSSDDGETYNTTFEYDTTLNCLKISVR